MQSKAPDPARIDIHDQTDRVRWAERLGISEAKLREVVRKFGTRPSTVRATLGLPPA